MTLLQERQARFAAADLYVVITSEFCAARPPLDVLEGVLTAGVKLVQLREKDRPAREVYELARAFRRLTTHAGALLIINDRVDLALAVDADGVQLGQNDLPLVAARDIAPSLLTGISTHSLDQALQAEADGAGYINIGPIFPTETKAVAVEPVGPEAIAGIAQSLGIPFSCMGGIKAGNLEQVLQHGARQVAVVTAVTAAPDIAAAASALRKIILSARQEQQ